MPLAAEPAEACATTVSDEAPPAPVFITIFGAAGAGGADGFGAGVSKTGFNTGGASGFLAGAAGNGLDGAFAFTAFFLTGATFLAAFFTGAGLFFLAAGFLAGAFLEADFLAMVIGGSELFQFLRG